MEPRRARDTGGHAHRRGRQTDRLDGPRPDAVEAFAAAQGAGHPPLAGDRWRFNVFRIERPAGQERPDEDAQYLAWSLTGQRTFHVVEAFRDLVFVDR